jgi:diaminopimelate decarboxylase
MGDLGWVVRDGRLWVEHLACSDLAARFGTPLYVISEARLRENARRLTTALAQAWPLGEVRVLASLKANPTLATRVVLTQEGLGCDTFGETELVAALRAGVPPGLISVNGASKSERLIGLAVEAGARITLDSARELPLVEAAAAAAGVRTRVRIRLRPRLAGLDAPSDLSHDGTSIRDAFQAYKAGVPIDDAVELGRAALRSSHVELVGLHVHLARQTADTTLWAAQIESFADLVGELSASWDGWVPGEIDVGGGWPSTLDPVGRRLEAGRQRPLPQDAGVYAGEVARTLAAALERRGLARPGTILEAEPGRAIYADAGLHLATVTNVKQQRDPQPQRWIETDTSEIFLFDTTLEGSLFPVVAVERPSAPSAGCVDVTGISCNFDLIAPAVELPDVAVGDVLAFLETGAYQEASAANFNGLPRPATVLVAGSLAELIKRRETVDDVLARDLVPDRLDHERERPLG